MDAQRTAHSMPGANEEESNSILEKLENDLRKVVDEWTADGKWLPSLGQAWSNLMRGLCASAKLDVAKTLEPPKNKMMP